MSETVCILIPIFNDWQTVTLLLERVDDALGEARAARPSLEFSVLIVDDG